MKKEFAVAIEKGTYLLCTMERKAKTTAKTVTV